MNNDLLRPYTVLAAIDFSEAGSLALDHAIEFVNGKTGAELHVVNVGLPAGSAVDLEFPLQVVRMTRADAMAYLSQHVETALGAFDTRAGTADARRVVTHHRLGDPSTEIVQLAADLDASLVVIGTHGRRGIRRLVMGSVAETVVRLAPCPVLVVRAMDLQQVPQIEPPCPACVAQRQRSAGAEMWCAQHKDSHARRHMFHYVDRNTAAAVDTLSPAGR